MLRKNKKRRQDDDIGPSTGIMKWTNKLFRLVLFPVIHPAAFISAIVIAALVILAVPAYFGIEFKDTFAWYRHQFDRSYSQVQTVVSQKNVEVLVDEAENKIKAMAGLGVNVKTIDKKPNNKELVAYEVQQNVVRRAFHQKTAGSGVDEGGRSDVRFKRASGLGLVYLDNPQKISGKVRVVNANELRIDGQLVFLYGIYADPASEKGKQAEEYLRNNAEGQEADCFIGAYAKDGAGTAICFCQGKNINQTLVDLNYSRNITLN